MEKQRKQGAYYRKGKTYEELYGLGKSKEIRKSISIGNKGKKISKKTILKRKRFYDEDNDKWLLRNKRISNSLKGKKHSKEAIEKMRKANLGRKSPMKGKHHSEETKRKMSVSSKGKPTWNKGKTNIYSIETLNKIREARKTQIFPLKDTSIEVKIQNFLKQLKIEFFTHQYMKIEHGYQCDILIPSKNLVIECDGDYWHEYPVGLEKDHIRTKELIDKGFKVLRLWEHEIKKMELNSFKRRLENGNRKGY